MSDDLRYSSRLPGTTAVPRNDSATGIPGGSNVFAPSSASHARRLSVSTAGGIPTGIPRTAGPSSRTMTSSAALGSSTSASRIPASTGRAGPLRSQYIVTSTKSSAGAAGSGLTRSVLGKRASGVAELDENPSSSSRETFAAQTKIMSLEKALSESKAENAELREHNESQQNEIWKLKKERGQLATRAERDRTEGESVEARWFEERTQKDKTISSLNQKLSSLSSAHAGLQSERDQAVGELAALKQSHKREVDTFTDQLVTLEQELEARKGWQRRAESFSIQLEEEKRKSQQAEAARLEAERSGKSSTLEGRGVGAGVGEQAEIARLRDEIKGLSQKLQMQQSSARRLESEVVEMRKAKKEAEVEKGSQTKMISDLKIELRGVNEQLKRAQHDMDSLTRTFPSDTSATSSPTSGADITMLQNRLSALSELHQTATESLAKTKQELEQLYTRHHVSTAKAHASALELSKQLQDAEREARWAKEGRAAAEQKERLAKEELSILRDTTSRAMPGGGSFGDDAARVSQLEQVIDMYKQQLDESERDSQAAEERIMQAHGLVKQAVMDDLEAILKEKQALITEQERRISDLESANATLDAEVADAARRYASGEFDPSRVRVLEFANNPAAKIKMTRLRELEALREENEALLTRLGELEDARGFSNTNETLGLEGGADTEMKRFVPRQSFDRLVKEKNELEESRAKRVLRLKEIFGAKSKEFLEAVYSLLGWKIKFDDAGRDIRLTSMYAPKGKMGLTLKFVSNEGHFGTMQMTGAMAKGLEEARHFWIVERQSVPGFLAQVTTECFEKTTIGRASGYVGLE